MQTRTPPALKWLLVERATLLGDLQRIQQRQQQLAEEASQLQAKLQALDETLRLTESRVNPAAAGSVRRHCPKYGYRGALKDFVVQVTHESDTGLSGRRIATLAAAHFGLEFASNQELYKFLENSIAPILQDLRREGVLESLPKVNREGMLWRAKRQFPTLAELAKASQAGRPHVLSDPA